MSIILDFQGYLYLVLGFVALGIELWAFVDCLRRSPGSFEGAFKRTKGFWTAMTGGAVAVGLLTALVTTAGLFGILQLAAVIAACVYLADVKPAVTQSTGNSYGSW